MHLLIALLFLAALQQSLEDKEDKKLSEGEEITESVLSAEEQKEIVDIHNELRGKVTPTATNMLKMVWDEKVAKNAQTEANTCRASISPDSDRTVDGVLCGQSVTQLTSSSSWSEIIMQWHNKVSNFKYGSGAINPKKDIGGYTQIVWYNSYRIGCAFANCRSSSRFPFRYLCHYCPVGNKAQSMARPYKKGPSCGDCPNNCENKLCTNSCPYIDIAENCSEMKKLLGCKHQLLKTKCNARCQCKTEII